MNSKTNNVFKMSVFGLDIITRGGKTFSELFSFYESLVLLAHFFFICVGAAFSETLSGNFGS